MVTTTAKTPKIYVACLSAYNNGKLHGAWIECDRDPWEIWADIKEMLANSPEPDAEEWAIHDSEGWGEIHIDESEDIEKLSTIANQIKEHGEAFSLYYDWFKEVENFEVLYLGEYDTEIDFVYEKISEQGIIEGIQKLGLQEIYIDLETMARDWFISDYLSLNGTNHKVYVFSRS